MKRCQSMCAWSVAVALTVAKAMGAWNAHSSLSLSLMEARIQHQSLSRQSLVAAPTRTGEATPELALSLDWLLVGCLFVCWLASLLACLCH